jgi:hypothetical protein
MYGYENSDNMKRKTPKSSKNRRIWSILNFNEKGTPKSSLIYQPIVGAFRAIS